MLPAVGAWITTPRATRKLLPTELAKGPKVPPEWIIPYLPLRVRHLNDLIGTHIWEVLGAPIEAVLANRPSTVGRLTKSALPPLNSRTARGGGQDNISAVGCRSPDEAVAVPKWKPRASTISAPALAEAPDLLLAGPGTGTTRRAI
jgi:hypothetical protein